VDEEAGAWEAEALAVRLASRSASNWDLISECGTDVMRRTKSVKWSESPVTFLAEALGIFGIHAPRLERIPDVSSRSRGCHYGWTS
jgi:hypothetical protein